MAAAADNDEVRPEFPGEGNEGRGGTSAKDFPLDIAIMSADRGRRRVDESVG